MLRPTLIAAALFAAPALAQMPTMHPSMPIPTTLSVGAEGRVERAPDVADLSAGVVTTAPTATEAMRLNAERMTAVAATIRKAGIAERDIQTAGLNLQPQYRYVQNEEPKLIGYQASNTVSLRVRDLKNMGRALDALVASGANQINGPNFRLDKPEPALDGARTEAVAAARARAELYAKAAGLRVKRILSISESGAIEPPRPYTMMRAMSAKAEDASTPVSPGEVSLTVTVNMTFELE